MAGPLTGLGDLPGLSLMPEPAWGRSSRWLSVILIDPAAAGTDREAVRRWAGFLALPTNLPLALRLAGGALAERENLTPAAYAQRLRDQQRLFKELSEVDTALEVSAALLAPSSPMGFGADGIANVVPRGAVVGGIAEHELSASERRRHLALHANRTRVRQVKRGAQP